MDDLPCEDATKVVRTLKGTIVAVADGHGDKRCLFASIGAKLAVDAACDVLKLYLKSVTGEASTYWNGLRREIATDISQTFACYVVNDYQSRRKEHITDQEVLALQEHIRGYFAVSEDSMSPEKLRNKYLNRKRFNDRLGQILFLYGTTVRASVLTDSYLFHCALGDGDTIAVIHDRVEWLLPQAEAYGCETASMCEPFETVVDSFLFSFVECRKSDAQVARSITDTGVCVPVVLLATDGLRNSFFSPVLFEEKIKEMCGAAYRNKAEVRVSNLKRLYEKLSMESVFQDDISTIIAVRTKKSNNMI